MELKKYFIVLFVSQNLFLFFTVNVVILKSILSYCWHSLDVGSFLLKKFHLEIDMASLKLWLIDWLIDWLIRDEGEIKDGSGEKLKKGKIKKKSKSNKSSMEQR